jgi:hypothetical protein
VEHEQRVLGRAALLDRDGHPALRILPVAGHRVPGHDRVAALHEVVHGDGVQQPLVEVPAAAEGPEQPVRMGEVAQQLLGEVDLAADAVGVLHAPEGHGVRVRVVGDPVPFRVRPLREPAQRRPGQALPEHAEERRDVAGGEGVEDLWCGLEVGAVVEGERDVVH